MSKKTIVICTYYYCSQDRPWPCAQKLEERLEIHTGSQEQTQGDELGIQTL